MSASDLALSRAGNERGIVLAGSLAQRPGKGGHAWVFLQYLLGFRALGFDVLFLDRLEPEMCVDAGGRPAAAEDSINLRYLEDVLGGFGLADSYAVLLDGGASSAGLDRPELLERVRSAQFLLNVNGFVADAEVLAAARRRVFLDIDPGFQQMWCELGLHDAFAGHDLFVTVGEAIGRPDCAIPTCGLDWIPTPQPVVLAEWPAQTSTDGPFTSVGSWRGPFAPVEYGGATYGLRAHEFRPLVGLPRLTGERFEIALDIDEADGRDLDLLKENGWSLADPAQVAADPWSYRDYLQRSRAELMVAKGMYVKAGSGWFSDRSICYLASGRPVIAQDTGFSRLYPSSEGLLPFTTMREAVAAVEQITDDYPAHSAAARALAEERFDSGRVLSRLMERLDG